MNLNRRASKQPAQHLVFLGCQVDHIIANFQHHLAIGQNGFADGPGPRECLDCPVHTPADALHLVRHIDKLITPLFDDVRANTGCVDDLLIRCRPVFIRQLLDARQNDCAACVCWCFAHVFFPLSDRSSSAHHAYAKWPGSSTRKIRIPSMRQSFDGRHVGLNPYTDANCSRQIANHNVMSMYTRVGLFPFEFQLSAHPSAIRAVALGENNGLFV